MRQEKTNPYETLRRTILACMILVPLTPFILVLVIGYTYFTRSIETSTIASMKRIVEDHRHMIDSFLNERRADLEFILHSYRFEDLAEPEMLYQVFGRLQKKSPAFVDLGLFNEEGIHVAYQGPFRLVGRDYSREEWFNEVMKKGEYISDIFLGFRRVPHFVIALSRGEEGRKWALRATIDTYLFNDLVEKIRIGKTGEAYLLNSKGLLQTERRSGGSLMDEDPDKIHSSPHEGIRTFIWDDARGDKFLFATTWLVNKEWLLVVRQEKADAFKPLYSAIYIIVLVTFVGCTAIVAVAFSLTNFIIRRLEQMDAEKDQLGEQLIRATRLAELGEMAAGFAHEINNPLQIIRSEQSLVETIVQDLLEKGALQESPDLSDLRDSMAQIRVQVDRCSTITQAILKFGRKGEPVDEEVDLGRFIPEVTGMISKKAEVHGIAVKEMISPDTPPIRGDRGQLQQVLLNLYNNAMDAIALKHGSKGGELTIKAAPTREGKVEISVTDNGSGISPENLSKIFSPFFTTKPVGRGTGLGLSVCYGIVDRMGGVMKVASEKGVGTTFTVLLPPSAHAKEGSPPVS